MIDNKPFRYKLVNGDNYVLGDLMNKFNESRRQFLTQSALGMLAFTALPNLAQAMTGMDMGATQNQSNGMTFPKFTPTKTNPSFKPDVELELFCKPNSVSILKGTKTSVLQYSAKLIKGAKGTLTTIPNSYLGSIIRLRKGQKVRIRLHNGLSQPTVTHWHGLHVPQLMDGHPQYAIQAGETLVYEFEVKNRASMNIYHPHPHGNTAEQVYRGLVGALIVNDDEEAALNLPSGKYEIPLVIQDKQFDTKNQLVYAPDDNQRMAGFYGDKILVNGHPNFSLDVESRAYRLRIVNGSTARIYKLAWDDGTPVTVLGVDGGLLEKPETKPYVMLAPAERLDVWADFSGRNKGSKLTLRSLAFSGVLPVDMMPTTALPLGSDFPICTIRVTKKVSKSSVLPTKLSKIQRYEISDTANPTTPLPIGITEAPMAVLLNGQPYEFNKPLPSERVKLDSVQLLEIFHAHGATDSSGMNMSGMNMAMAHPIHLHGQSFQIMGRNFEGVDSKDYDTVKDGFIDSGLKDTVLIMPIERIRIIKPFQDFKGLFLYHCHNLQHEDMGMMREFSVE